MTDWRPTTRPAITRPVGETTSGPVGEGETFPKPQSRGNL